MGYTDLSAPSGQSYTVVGWREWVGFPDSGVAWLKAKIDTGARTSALHAFDVEPLTRDGAAWLAFSVHPWQATDEDAVRVERPLLERREVRSSSGHVEERPVVALTLRLGGRTVETEVTLTNRDEMGFRMLVGRETLRQDYLVDPAADYLGGRPPVRVRRRNRGR